MNISQTTIITALFLWWVQSLNIVAQNTLPDSLQEQNFGTLQQHFYNHRHNKTQAYLYAQCWLSKAKKAKNTEQQIWAYKALAYASTQQKLQYVYLDSMVTVALQSHNNTLIGAAYLSKGIYLYQDLNHQQALDNYLLADSYIVKTKNQYQSHKVQYQIAQTKYQLGFYDEAVALLVPCATYFENQNDQAYLNTLYALSLCYNSLGKFNKASQLINNAKQRAISWQYPELLPYFTLSEAINQYGQKKYDQAAHLASQAIIHFKSNNDQPNLAQACFVAGKSFWQRNNKTTAIEYFKKIDHIFSNKKYIRPELLQSYELLINYYKQQGNTQQALYYANQFIVAEQTSIHDYKYLSSKILRKYNPKLLRQELQELQQKNEQQQYGAYTLITALMLGLTYTTYRYRQQRKLYHIKFTELIQKNNQTNQKQEQQTIQYNENELKFSEELAQKLLKRLELFESRHEYIQPDMSLQKLADKLNTNQKYVTKLLSHYRAKRTIEYISDLKIDYIAQKLQTDKKFRNYTNKALGQEVGFGSTQIFTRTFKNRIGMPPTVFIQELNQLDEQKQQNSNPSVNPNS